MKTVITIFIVLTWNLPAIAQSPVNNTKADTTDQKYILEYDPGVLRVKGNSLPIGIVAMSNKGQRSQTTGFLNGTDD